MQSLLVDSLEDELLDESLDELLLSELLDELSLELLDDELEEDELLDEELELLLELELLEDELLDELQAQQSSANTGSPESRDPRYTDWYLSPANAPNTWQSAIANIGSVSLA